MTKLKKLEREQMLSKENANLRDDRGGSGRFRRKRDPRRQSAIPLCLQRESRSSGSELERKEALKRETDEGSSSMQGKEDDAVGVTEEMD